VPVLLAAVSARAQVRDLAVEEPGIEDVVRRIYATTREVPDRPTRPTL